MTAAPTTLLAAPRLREIARIEEIACRWNEIDLLVPAGQKPGRYIAGFAASDRCVLAAKRLRFEVFNLELNEGLSSALLTGIDEDEFDAQMTHLVLMEAETGRVAGTYRLQTAANGLAHSGLYAAGEFDLAALAPYLGNAIECGRACIAAEDRNLAALMMLWSGLGAFITLNASRWLFGCCSLTTTDPADGWRAMLTIKKQRALHGHLLLPPLEAFKCGLERIAARTEGPALEAIPLPRLFRTYLRLGASVISEPAIDREFGTVDFLILMDSSAVTLSSLEPA